MSNTARLVTAEKFEKFLHDDSRYELVDGRVIPMTPVTFTHGRVVIRLGALLDSHVRSGGNAAFVVTEVGFKLASNPDTVRAPDVAVIRQSRVPSPAPRGFLNGAPDLAVEVLSPDDRPGDVQEKVAEYLTRGVPLVVVIDPECVTASVSRPSSAPVLLRDDDVLDLDEVVPGFRCRVREIFE
jgi:Uma2 family endonuclease